MDIGAEISKKIQMAITAKLKELDAYVDDELPDYIMIMVANKKTEQQMTDALSLFLSDNTKAFTSWLHSLLATLRKTKTVDGKSKHSEIPVKEESEFSLNETNSISKKESIPSTRPVVNTEQQSDSVIPPPVVMKKVPVKVEKTAQETSEAIITISHESADVLDEELLLNQTDSSLILDSALDTDVLNTSREEERKSSSQSDLRKEIETKKTTLEDKTETKRKFSESSRHRKESESKNEQKSSERKRKSDEHGRRRSHRSRSPVAKSRREERKDSSSKSKTERASASHTSSRRTSHDIRRTYRLESDSRQYARSSSRSDKAPVEKSESSVREWDMGKGDDIEKEILANWERRQRNDKKHSWQNKKKEEEWLSSDNDESETKGKGLVSSAITAVKKDPEFVSDSESDDGNITKASAVNSKVAFPQRKIRVPLGKQANKALLIKAVSEAEKSVRKSDNLEDGEEEDADDEAPLIHGRPPSKPRGSIKSRLTLNAKDSKTEKSGKLRRKSSDKKEKRKNVIEKILTRPMYQDLERKERPKDAFKEVIVVRKNLNTGDRTSSTHKSGKTQVRNDKSPEAAQEPPKAQRRKKPSQQQPTKVILLDEQDDNERPVTVIHVRRKNHAGKREKVIYVEGSSSSEEDKSPPTIRRDKRNFIHRAKEESSEDDLDLNASGDREPAVHFDSRRAKAHSPQRAQTDKKKQKATAKVSPRLQSTQQTALKTSKVLKQNPTPAKESGSQSPRFIVTLDGVAPPKQLGSEGKNQTETPNKNFKFKPVTAPTIAKTSQEKVPVQVPTAPIVTPVQKPVVIQTSGDTEDDNEEMTDSELMKMRKKLIKVQEEATKLKQMQAKLAAVQGIKTTTSGGGMYTDKVDSEQKSIFVGNVHFSVAEKQLSEYFSICGKVERVTILKDPFTGHPKGFAYLEFEDRRAVASALALDNTTLKGRVIRVTLKQSKGAIMGSFPPFRGQRYQPRRAFSTRPKAKYYAPGFVPTPRYRLTAPLPSKNKTWVNPAIMSIQK